MSVESQNSVEGDHQSSSFSTLIEDDEEIMRIGGHRLSVETQNRIDSAESQKALKKKKKNSTEEERKKGQRNMRK